MAQPFTPITSLPSSLWPYWISNDPGYIGYNPCLIRDTSTGSVLPNCTGWCYGAWMFHCGLTAGGYNWENLNANNWFADVADGYQRSQTPVLGSIMCFASSGAGHVAMVEEVDPNGQWVRCSESDYSGNAFTYRTRYLSYGWNEYGYSHLTFQGCIIPPVSFTDAPAILYLKKKKKGGNHVRQLL